MATLNNQINLQEVKKVLDNADWNYEYCGDLGRDTEKALYYLGTQIFSISKIEEFLHLIENEDLEDAEIIAKYLADPLAWDRISKYVWSDHNKGANKWSISESTSFKIE